MIGWRKRCADHRSAINQKHRTIPQAPFLSWNILEQLPLETPMTLRFTSPTFRQTFRCALQRSSISTAAIPRACPYRSSCHWDTQNMTSVLEQSPCVHIFVVRKYHKWSWTRLWRWKINQRNRGPKWECSWSLYILSTWDDCKYILVEM